MNIKTWLVLSLSLVALISCGSESNGPTSVVAQKEGLATKKVSQVVFTVTGAVSAQVDGRAHMFCSLVDGGPGKYIEIEYVTTRTMLSLSLLADASGDIELVGSRESGAQAGKTNTVQFRSEELDRYRNGSGRLTIKAMPAAEGDKFVASLVAKLTDKTGESTNITAEYDTVAGYQSFDEC